MKLKNELKTIKKRAQICLEKLEINNNKLQTAADGVDITGTLDVSVDVNATGSVKCTQNLRRTITAVTLSTNTATCTLTANDNFSFTLNNAANTINIVTAAENVGQSGTIVATNPSSVGSFSVNAIQGNGDIAEVLTPDGATISWPSTANAVNLISYYVAAQDKILINFIGNFTNP